MAMGTSIAGGGGSGGVAGPTSGVSTDNAIARWDGTTGTTLQNSAVTVSDVAATTVTVASTAGNTLALLSTANTATTGASQAGKTLTITASAATASTDTDGAAAGGSVTITAGAAARRNSGNANGGDINLVPGAGIGTGTTGQVIVPFGTVAAPGLAFATASTRGFYGANGGTQFAISGVSELGIYTQEIRARVGSQFSISSNAPDSNAGDIGYGRSAAGVGRVTNGSSGLGQLLTGRLVEANTAGSGSPNILVANESRTLLTNEGTTAENYHTLVTAAAGYSFTFYCQDSDGIRIVANTGDTIRLAGNVSAAAGFVRSVVIGSSVTLESISAAEWVATSIVGTWTIDV